jgi:putative spermidine/putrescine transport system ATP-binding protein
MSYDLASGSACIGISMREMAMLNKTPSTLSGQSLILDRVTHRYGAAVAVQDVSLDITAGELVALLGPSGCGKTTLLRAVGGFITQSSGQIMIGGKSVDHLPPNRRSVGIVFQNYALFPHMTAADNVAYGLEARRVAKPKLRARVEEMLRLVKLSHLAARYPRELSGGQQQRVALARALAVHPSILLLDEPFAALDKNLRLDMQIEIKRIQRLSGATTLIVTHDQEEALSMADRVAVFDQGQLEQLGTPIDIYDNPASLFVNTFVGTANRLSGRFIGSEGGLGRVKLDIGGDIAVRASRERLAPGDLVTVCIRPEHMCITESEGIPGTVEMGLPLGSTIVHEIRTTGGRSFKITEPRSSGTEPRPPGTAVHVKAISPESVSVFRQSSISSQ